MAREQVQQFIEQATQSIQSGQFDGALQLIDQALALSPNEADAYILRGICLSQTGQPAAATEAFGKAIELDPNSAKARYNLAVHLYALGQKTEALKAAREAANLDPAHSGARQLITNLESELAGPSARATMNHNDPLAAPPTQAPTAVPPAASSPAPQSNPYGPPTQSTEVPRSEPAMPSPPPVGQMSSPVSNPYMKSQYDGPAHSLPFVENMGKAWVTLGWVLSGLSLFGFIMAIVAAIGAFSLLDNNDTAAFERAFSNSPAVLVSRITGLISLVGILIWSIMDLIDRRGNFIWLIPNIICSCCGFGWLTLPIYILAGRNN